MGAAFLSLPGRQRPKICFLIYDLSQVRHRERKLIFFFLINFLEQHSRNSVFVFLRSRAGRLGVRILGVSPSVQGANSSPLRAVPSSAAVEVMVLPARSRQLMTQGGCGCCDCLPVFHTFPFLLLTVFIHLVSRPFCDLLMPLRCEAHPATPSSL